MMNIGSLLKIVYGRSQAFYSNGINKACEHGDYWVLGENCVHMSELGCFDQII